MLTMLKYLKSLKQIVSSAAFSEYTVVVGNQSADMDSVCSALLTAYLETVVNDNKAVPLIGIPLSDLRLRRDIEYVLNGLEIDKDWLLFTDNVTLTDETKLFLVDHNAPTEPGRVVSVLDHHDIEDPKLDLSAASPMIRTKSGSCASVVVDYYRRNFVNATAAAFEKEPKLAQLALSPILLDTNELTSKVENVDKEAVAFLKDFLKPGLAYSPFNSFATIKKEKKSIEGFTMRDLLRKDYKRWDSVGISSLPTLIEKLVKKGLQDLPNAMERYKKQENLEIMIALANGNNKRTDEYERQLVYCGPLDFDVAAECPSLELELKSEVEGVRFYQQHNVAASRKQVAPAVKAAWLKYRKTHPTD